MSRRSGALVFEAALGSGVARPGQAMRREEIAVLVENALRGDRFDILEESGEKARAKKLGARVITLGHLAEHDLVV